MANSGSGADDDSFFSTTGGGTTMPASSGAEYRNSSTQASNSNFNSSGDRSSKNTSHHQQPSREGGRRDRYDRLFWKKLEVRFNIQTFRMIWWYLKALSISFCKHFVLQDRCKYSNEVFNQKISLNWNYTLYAYCIDKSYNAQLFTICRNRI